MTTIRRQRRSQHTGLITQEAVDAFKRADWIGLHRALRLKPWEASPLDSAYVVSAEVDGTGYARTLPRARQLRAELEAFV
jgi:hypothetical protein